jgi:hypothetical protein
VEGAVQDRIREEGENGGTVAPFPPEIVNDYERRIILDKLELCGWSQTEAAEALHVPRWTIKIRKKDES